VYVCIYSERERDGERYNMLAHYSKESKVTILISDRADFQKSYQRKRAYYIITRR
jgi:hypothetical protein